MSTQAKAGRLLIMGIGNYLMGDEGLGVHLAQRLAQQHLPEGLDVLDGGTGGFHLMQYFDDYRVIILVDATLDDREPGSFRVLQPRFSADFPKALSTHDIGLKDLVEGLTILGRLPQIFLFAVSIQRVQPQTTELSPEVSAALPALEDAVKSLAAQLLKTSYRPGAAV